MEVEAAFLWRRQKKQQSAGWPVTSFLPDPKRYQFLNIVNPCILENWKTQKQPWEGKKKKGEEEKKEKSGDNIQVASLLYPGWSL